MVCIILTSVLRSSLLTSLPLFLEHSSDPSSCFSLLFLPPGSHTVANCSAYSILFLLLFFKAGAAGYLQNDLFFDSISKLKIVCYIAMIPVAIGLHFLLTCALSHYRWLRDASRTVRDSLEDCFQGADLAERWDSSFPHLLPNCCLDFSFDGCNSCSCIGQSCNLGDR